MLHETTIGTVAFHHDITIQVADGSRCGILEVILIVVLHDPGTFRAGDLFEFAYPVGSVDLVVQLPAAEVVTGFTFMHIGNVFANDFSGTFNLFECFGVDFKEGGGLVGS